MGAMVVKVGPEIERARDRQRHSPGTQSEAGEFGGRLRMFLEFATKCYQPIGREVRK
jgi:hypothetical protein